MIINSTSLTFRQYFKARPDWINEELELGQVGSLVTERGERAVRSVVWEVSLSCWVFIGFQSHVRLLLPTPNTHLTQILIINFKLDFFPFLLLTNYHYHHSNLLPINVSVECTNVSPIGLEQIVDYD